LPSTHLALCLFATVVASSQKGAVEGRSDEPAERGV
jgi:hypothetical protein